MRVQNSVNWPADLYSVVTIDSFIVLFDQGRRDIPHIARQCGLREVCDKLGETSGRPLRGEILLSIAVATFEWGILEIGLLRSDELNFAGELQACISDFRLRRPAADPYKTRQYRTLKGGNGKDVVELRMLDESRTIPQ